MVVEGFILEMNILPSTCSPLVKRICEILPPIPGTKDFTSTLVIISPPFREFPLTVYQQFVNHHQPFATNFQ